MSDREIFVSSKTSDGNICSPSTLPSSFSDKSVPLTEEKRKTAEAAKWRAMEILRDALKKKDRVLMEKPQVLVFGGTGDPKFWMERHAVLTEELVTALISELENVKFKEDPTKENTYAYVYPKSEDKTVYLCPRFWESSTDLRREYSQPGTLIHEVSHFLGTCDITYAQASIDVACRGMLLKSSPYLPELDLIFLCLAELNANNITYEFEITLNHKGKYENGQYSCCGEKAVNSVCERVVPDEFLFHTCKESSSGKKDIAEILKESLLQARDTLKRNLPELRKIADDIDEVHRVATIANVTGGTVGIAGGITTIVGLALAPVTFGASLIVSLTGLGVSTLGGLTSAAATATDLGVNKVKKETVEKLLEECQSALKNINQCIKIIQVSAQSMKDDGGGDLLLGLAQIGSGAGRVVLNAMKMAKAGQLLANAGRVARFAGNATRVLTALTLGLDIFFVAKDSRELYNGAKTDLAANIRDAVKEMEQVYDQVNQMCM